MTPLFASKASKKRRALTVYFATAEQKQNFDKLAAGFGLTSSALGMLILYAGMERGFEAVSKDMMLRGSPASVVQSRSQNPDQGASTARKRIRPRTRKKRTPGRSS